MVFPQPEVMDLQKRGRPEKGIKGAPLTKLVGAATPPWRSAACASGRRRSSFRMRIREGGPGQFICPAVVDRRDGKLQDVATTIIGDRV